MRLTTNRVIQPPMMTLFRRVPMKQLHSKNSFRFRFLETIIFIVLYFTMISASARSGITYTSSHHNFTVMIANDRYLWAGTDNEGLLRFEISDETVLSEPILYTASNSGLSDNYIRALTFDAAGALLIGTTTDGVVRFDGKQWEELSGAPRSVLGLAVENSGAIWVHGQSTGVSRLSESTWSPVMNTFTGFISAYPLSNSVWLYTRLRPVASECNAGMLYEYVNGGMQSAYSLEPLCPETNYPTLFCTDEKSRWLGNHDELIRINGSGITRFPVKTDTNREKSLTALAVNINNVLLAALAVQSSRCEIYLLNQISTPKEKLFDSAVVILPDLYIKTACADYNDNFWLGTSNGTIINVTPHGIVTEATKTGGAELPGNSINSLCIDTVGNIWVGLNTKLSSAVNISPIVKFNGEQWASFPGPGDTLPGRKVSALACDSSGMVWAGFQQNPIMSSIQCGLACFNGQNWQRINQNHFSVKAIVFDKDGILWSVAHNGVSRYKDQSSEMIFETKGSSAAHIALGTQVNTIAFDNNNIPYIGTGLGIKKFINNEWIDDSTLTRFFPARTIATLGSEIAVTALCFEPTGTQWIGTAQGLVRCDDNDCSHFDSGNGLLPHPTIQCITTDGKGSTWIGTKGGLVHFSGVIGNVYTTANSPLLDNDITAIALKKNSDVWVGTRAGGVTVLPQINPLALTRPSVTPHESFRKGALLCRRIPHGNIFRLTVSSGLPPTARLSVLSLKGDLIRQLRIVSSKTGSFFDWDGKDVNGRAVPKAVYLAVIKNNGKVIGCTRLQLIR